AADAPPKLRYGFQKDQQYAYDVKVAIDMPQETISYDGVLTYTMLSATDKQFVWKCTGNLPEKITAKEGAGTRRPRLGRRPGPPSFPSAFRHFGPFGQPRPPEGTTLDRCGTLVVEGNFHAMPCLLGWQELLVIEKLPEDPKATWDKKTDLLAVEKEQATTPFGHPLPFGETETKRGAVEQINFAVSQSSGDTVRVSKKYSFKTVAAAGGSLQIDMSGDGEFAFDLKAGAIKSLSMKYKILIGENNVSVTLPTTLSYRLLTAAELAEKKRKDEQAAAALAEAQKPKAISTADRSKLLADLRSTAPMVARQAAQRLSKSIADDSVADVSRALVRAMKSGDDWLKADCLAALEVWATPQAEAAVIDASTSKSFLVRNPAVKLLGKKFKSPAAAEAVAAQFPQCRMDVAAALKAMGPVAERAALPFLADRDVWVRSDAVGVLGEVGGAKSLAALKAEAKKNLDFMEKHAIEQALAALERRVAAVKDDAEADAQAAGGPKLRTWHDASGSFEVEAAFVRADAEKVTILKKNGRELTVPLAKLSDEDQEYVKTQNKPKPVNPFQ
ncbi:MAG: SHD1 domain-containing protein, partial [Thermoguttaceae bacterium]